MVSFFGAVVVLMFAASATACSTYGWADAANDDSPATSIYVEPVSAPAHLGLDTSALRAQLIDELHRQGVAADGSPDATSLQCTLRREQTTGFSVYAVARIALDCDIRHHRGDAPPTRLEATGLATDRLLSGDDVAESAEASSRRAPTLAAVDAISRLSPQIADTLHHHRHHSNDE